MENKNLNDIIIEDAETSKGNQLKNILTLLALLFIILVISIVITKLILGGDDETDSSYRTDGTVQELGDNNLTTMASNGLSTAGSTISDTARTAGAATLAGAAAVGAATVALTSKNSSNDNATHNTRENMENTTASIDERSMVSEKNTTLRTKTPLRAEDTTKKSVEVTQNATHTTPPKKKHNIASTYTRPKYIKHTTTSSRPKHTTSHSTTRSTRTTHRTSHQSSSKKVTRGYYIKVGTFANPSTAIRNIKAIKLNYKTTKSKSGLTRVLIGPFYSQRDAQNHLAKAKANVASDAYIAKIK